MEPLEVVAADRNDGTEEDLNTTESTVAAMFGCSAATSDADKPEEPAAAAEVERKLLSAEDCMYDFQTEQLARACWDSGLSQSGNEDGLEIGLRRSEVAAV